MSNRRFVSTLGAPYVAFIADNIGDVDSLPGRGVSTVELDLRADLLPVQNTSADEIHPFFAFDHDLGLQPLIFEVGVTPSGALKAQAKDGGTWASGTALFTGSGVWQNVQVSYNIGVWQVVVDGTDITASGTTTAPGPPAYLVPNAGYGTRIMLFNGRDGLARSGVSVSRLLVAFTSGSGSLSQLLVWQRLHGSGSSLTPELFLVSEAAKVPLSPLVAQVYDPLFSAPWGTVPAGGPGGLYSYGLETDWSRRPKPTTAWTRVAA